MLPRDFITYEASTGRILSLTKNQDFALSVSTLPEGYLALPVTDSVPDNLGRGYRVVEGAIVHRETMPLTVSGTEIAADGQSVLSVAGIPAGASLRLVGPIADEWVEQDGVTEITTTEPGEYQLVVDFWPYKTARVDFNAT
jgi:hypothetical protein